MKVCRKELSKILHLVTLVEIQIFCVFLLNALVRASLVSEPANKVRNKNSDDQEDENGANGDRDDVIGVVVAVVRGPESMRTLVLWPESVKLDSFGDQSRVGDLRGLVEVGVVVQ